MQGARITCLLLGLDAETYRTAKIIIRITIRRIMKNVELMFMYYGWLCSFFTGWASEMCSELSLMRSQQSGAHLQQAPLEGTPGGLLR
mmetsp:Transcript_4020/g.9095  ORF Transcript_4020/g.9095 Transcript_4020/m.9095 type:complete len:88 (-) Transcript_4020:147-410(-)